MSTLLLDRMCRTNMEEYMIKPHHDRVIVKLMDGSNRTASGLIIPEQAQEKPNIGEVLAVGPGRKEHGQPIGYDMTSKVGDKVIFSKYTGSEVEYEGQSLIIMRDEDILGTL